ncbi:MAG: hypothetical protein NZ957_04525 [Thaumarchaeota archaeon]|nr:hypothetical protein [Candidatus Calditenuaceae archaeon]MDW8041444.1 hypothetical protein [Nitrososphaerota archaeon]
MAASQNAREAMEFLVGYFERVFKTSGSYRWHEDEIAYYLFVKLSESISLPELKCFDERKLMFGRRRVFCYDEENTKRISITLDYSRKTLKLVTLALFKPGVRLKWPPKASPT